MSQTASKLKGLIWLLAIVIMAIIIGRLLVRLPTYIPWSWEAKLAKVINTPAQRVCVLKPQTQTLLNKLVKRIYPIYPNDKKFSIHIVVAKDPEINAYTQLNGYIIVNTGLVAQAQSADELAGVLAHEIEHVHHRHVFARLLNHLLTKTSINWIFPGSSRVSGYWSAYILNMHFSRSEEAQADYASLQRLQYAEVNNHGMQKFFKRMIQHHNNSTFLSDHPSDISRLDMTKHFNNTHTYPILTTAEWDTLKEQISSCTASH